MQSKVQGKWRPPASKEGVITAQLDSPPLRSDTYRVSLWLGDANMDYDERRDAVEFQYSARTFYPQSPQLELLGPVDLPWRWSFTDRVP